MLIAQILSKFSQQFYTGLGSCGELARSQNMTEPSQDGSYDLGENFYYTVPRKFTDAGGVEHVEMNPSTRIVMDNFLKPQAPLWEEPVPAPFSTKKVVLVACGAFHILVAAISSEDSVPLLYSSGHNACGQLGLGDLEQQHKLTNVPTVKDISQVAAGVHHSLALSTDGRCFVCIWK